MLWCLSSRSLLGPSINVASPIPDIGQSQSMSGLALQGEATTLVYRASHHQVQKVNWQQVESLTIVDKSLTVVVQLRFSNLCSLQCQVARASIWRYDIGIMTLNQTWICELFLRRGFGTVFFEICTLEGIQGTVLCFWPSCVCCWERAGESRQAFTAMWPSLNFGWWDCETNCCTARMYYVTARLWIRWSRLDCKGRWAASQSKPFPVQAHDIFSEKAPTLQLKTFLKLYHCIFLQWLVIL